MKTTIANAKRTGRWIGHCVALLAMILASDASGAAQFDEAKVTAVVQDVKLLRGESVLRSAVVNDEVRQGTAVRTGIESRSELTFPDLTIARLGANTIFSFNEAAREVKLFNGAILLRVPKDSAGAKITTDAVTAGIVGTTVMMEFHPRGIAKFIVLEGVARLYLRNRLGESILVHAGQMMIVRTGATHLDDPVDVDISQIMKTSLLITGFPPLPSESLIASEESKQMEMKSEGQLIDTNLVIFGSGTAVTLTDETDIARAAAPAGAPEGGKFGPITTITNPDPFPITSATQINTDPTITTGNVTASGKIYRGRDDDGPLSEYLFGSTSSFDTALKYDTEFFADPNNLPVAFFKFQDLTLLGNPTIAVGQNGVTKLGLVGVNGITSGPPGGSLTFDGLDLLVLATKAGPIDLTSDLSFQNLKTLVIYARGAGSNLTLASPILNSNAVMLAAEGSMRLALGITVTDRFAFQTGSDLISTGSGKFTVDNIGRTIDDAGRIRFKVGGNLSSQDLSLLIANNDGGHIGSTAEINVTTGGNLATGTVNFSIANNDGGHIGGNATVDAVINGDIISQTLTLFAIANTPNGSGTPAGTITGDALIGVTAGSISIGDHLGAVIFNHVGGSIGGDAAIHFNLSGDLGTQNAESDASFFIWNFGGGTGLEPGGMIGGDAVISLTAANLLTVATLSAQILNQNDGRIGGNAIMNFNVSGDIDTGGLSFIINNIGGAIGQDARISLTAANISIGRNLDLTIDNNTNGGTIGGAAVIDMNPSGTVTVASDATVQVLGSGLEGSEAINFNGGAYNVGGTFFTTISADGRITFNNANIAADVVKVGVFGTNGTLRIGGGSITGDTLLQLYAPGSNGAIDFVSNVTLRTSNAIPTIVANTVTIENGVVVTIEAQADGVPFPADVFTNIPNYTGFGGNGSTTGTFAGEGANDPIPTSSAPPFATAATNRLATVRSNSNTGVKTPPRETASPRGSDVARRDVPRLGSAKSPTVRVTDTSQLQFLLDQATSRHDGRVLISSRTRDRNTAGQSPGRTSPYTAHVHRTADPKVQSGLLAARPPYLARVLR